MVNMAQLLIVAFATVFMLFVLGHRTSHSGRAWKKIGLMLLALAMIVTVLFPDVTNVVAHAVGIGRGADLLLYATVLAFITYAVNNYLKQQDQRDALYRLSRKVALMDANERYDIKKK